MSRLRTAAWCGGVLLLLWAVASAPTAAQQGPHPESEPEDGNPQAAVSAEIEVRADPPRLVAAAEQIRALPGGVTMIDLAVERERSLRNLADALLYVPGVWSKSNGAGDIIGLSIRGSNLDATDYDMNGVQLLQDGLPVTAADGNNHNRLVDPQAARFATVARGANAVTWGASTLGGAINFVTPSAREIGAWDARLEAGSFGMGALRATSAHHEQRLDGVLTLDVQQQRGFREHARQDRRSFYGNAGILFTPAISGRLYLSAIDHRQELPRELTREQFHEDPRQAGSSTVAGHHQRNVETWRLAARGDRLADGDRGFEFGLSFEEQALYHPIVWVAIDDVEIFSLLIDTDHHDRGAMFRSHQQFGDHGITFGLQHGDSTVGGGHFRNLAGRRNGRRARIHQDARSSVVFLSDTWRWNARTTLTLGVQAVDARREVLQIAVPGGDTIHPRARYRNWNPRVGFTRALPGALLLYGNLSRVFEAPTNFQLEDNVAGGDAVLAPMRGTVAEIGLRGEWRSAQGRRRWTWDVAAYHARIADEILSVDDPLAPGTSLATNIDRTRHAGIEAVLQGRWDLGPRGRYWLEPRWTATWNDFRFVDDVTYGDGHLPAAPRQFSRAELILRSAGGWFTGPAVEHVGRRYADFSNEFEVDSHTLLGWRSGFEAVRWLLSLELHNLDSRDHVATVSVRDRGAPGDALLYPGEGRALRLGLTWRGE